MRVFCGKQVAAGGSKLFCRGSKPAKETFGSDPVFRPEPLSELYEPALQDQIGEYYDVSDPKQYACKVINSLDTNTKPFRRPFSFYQGWPIRWVEKKDDAVYDYKTWYTIKSTLIQSSHPYYK
eukprot:1914627-Pyramimonas_sp.AAC.2